MQTTNLTELWRQPTEQFSGAYRDFLSSDRLSAREYGQRRHAPVGFWRQRWHRPGILKGIRKNHGSAVRRIATQILADESPGVVHLRPSKLQNTRRLPGDGELIIRKRQDGITALLLNGWIFRHTVRANSSFYSLRSGWYCHKFPDEHHDELARQISCRVQVPGSGHDPGMSCFVDRGATHCGRTSYADLPDHRFGSLPPYGLSIGQKVRCL